MLVIKGHVKLVDAALFIKLISLVPPASLEFNSFYAER